MINTVNVLSETESIGYYFRNWNSNVISISVLIVAVLLLSGYFYGKLFERFFKSLKNVDCTVLGVFFIVSVFQLEVYWGVSTMASTDVAYWLLLIVVFAGPVVCLCTWTNVLPSWKHLVSLLLGIFITIVLCISSSKMTTNNIYFDTIQYLSQTLESSEADYFGWLTWPSGYSIGLDYLHDYNGYCYLWGMILKMVKTFNFFEYDGLYTPIYIWGATILYGMCLSNLVVSSANVLQKKMGWKWKTLIICVAFISPYYTNYWNTTLGFFGNTIRTVMVGYACLIIYQLLKKRGLLDFIPLLFVYWAGICFSSSSLFLEAFLCAGLFFALCFAKEKRWKVWIGFVISCYPVLHYGLLIVTGSAYSWWLYFVMALVGIGILCLIVWLLRNHLDIACKVGRILLPVAFVGIAALSLLKSSFGYEYFFERRSEGDMTVNMTSHTDTKELIRNIIFYVSLACIFVNFKRNKRFKIFLLILLLLFLNPLVQPFVSTALTDSVYSRSFDLLTNPFTLSFLICNIDSFISLLPVNLVLNMILAGFLVIYYAVPNLTTIISAPLKPDEDWGFNWVSKVTEDSEDLYTYIQENISDAETRPTIMSQDVGLKGYVTGIRINFNCLEYRDALSKNSEDLPYTTRLMIHMLYPSTKYSSDDLDYSELEYLVDYYNPDYLVISNTMALWDERGWYDSVYADIVREAKAEVIYENKTWALLKIDHSWEHSPKNETRYWVHKYDYNLE